MRHAVSLLVGIVLTVACAPAVQTASESALFVFRFDPASLVQLDSSAHPVREIPVTIPDGCGLAEVDAPVQGSRVSLELNCAFGQAVVIVNTDSGTSNQPVTDSDSHFLAWSSDGQALYLKVNSINRPRIVRVESDGSRTTLPISEFTYDIAARPSTRSQILFATSPGMGLGSEFWSADEAGVAVSRLLTDQANYLSLARWSPDGKQIAFIKIPDSPSPFTVGQLWVMREDATEARSLADADAGHGFAPSWSPTGNQIAFVHRENPGDAIADQSATALVSNIHAVSLGDGSERALTTFSGAQVEGPEWQPDGNTIAFTVVANDRMTAYLLDARSGRLQQVEMGSTCCAVWIRK